MENIINEQPKVVITKDFWNEINSLQKKNFCAVTINNELHLVPVARRSKKYLKKVDRLIEITDEEIAKGESTLYKNVDDLIRDLNSNQN